MGCLSEFVVELVDWVIPVLVGLHYFSCPLAEGSSLVRFFLVFLVVFGVEAMILF